MRRVYVKPSDLRLVVGRGTVAQLAGDVPLAVNASFFDPATYAIWSNVALNGKRLGETMGPHPYLAVKGGRAWFGRGVVDPSTVDWAAGAGPMLLEGGQRGKILPGENYGSDILAGDRVKNKRMAVGLTPDGRVCIITLEGTFEDLRRELLAAGCTDAMNLDGGSSAQWVEHGKLIEGSPRMVVDALVADRIIDDGIIVDLIPAGRRNRPGIAMQPTSITIHDTANPAKGADALAHARYIKSDSAGTTSWHYTVDDKRVVQHLPISETANHSGTVEGNRTSIGIEICENADGDRAAAEARAAALVANLLIQLSLPLSAVKQHYDWNGKDCPHILRHRPGGWEGFLAAVKAHLPVTDSEEDRLRARVTELEQQVAALQAERDELRARVQAIRDLIAQWK